MVVCDAKYKFTLVDIGDTGKQSDDSVYTNSHLGYAIEYGRLNIPQSSNLHSLKEHFRMFSLEMMPLVWKTTWWNHAHSKIVSCGESI